MSDVEEAPLLRATTHLQSTDNCLQLVTPPTNRRDLNRFPNKPPRSSRSPSPSGQQPDQLSTDKVRPRLRQPPRTCPSVRRSPPVSAAQHFTRRRRIKSGCVPIVVDQKPVARAALETDFGDSLGLLLDKVRHRCGPLSLRSADAAPTRRHPIGPNFRDQVGG